MIDWTTPIEDKTTDSKIWQERHTDRPSSDGCYICGSHDHLRKCGFGRLHINKTNQHYDTGGHLVTTREYSYAPPIRRYLCEDCIRWHYAHAIDQESPLALFIVGSLMLPLGIVLTYFLISLIVQNKLDDFMAVIVLGAFCVLGLGMGIGLLVGGIMKVVRSKKIRETFSDDDCDVALATIYTGMKSSDINRDMYGTSYYTQKNSGKGPNDPFLVEKMKDYAWYPDYIKHLSELNKNR